MIASFAQIGRASLLDVALPDVRWGCDGLEIKGIGCFGRQPEVLLQDVSQHVSLAGICHAPYGIVQKPAEQVLLTLCGRAHGSPRIELWLLSLRLGKPFVPQRHHPCGIRFPHDGSVDESQTEHLGAKQDVVHLRTIDVVVACVGLVEHSVAPIICGGKSADGYHLLLHLVDLLHAFRLERNEGKRLVKACERLHCRSLPVEFGDANKVRVGYVCISARDSRVDVHLGLISEHLHLQP